jgi:hypothetical protein
MTLAMTEFASRPVRVASAVKIAFLILGATVCLAAGKALLAQGLAAPALPEPAAPALVARGAVEPIAARVEAPGRDVCRRVEVEIDEGYGVRGHVTRWVCRKAL